MNRYSLTHLSDEELLRQLKALAAQESAASDALHAHFAEADARQLDDLPADDQLRLAVDEYRSETEQANAEPSPQPEPQAEPSPGTVEAPARQPELTQIAPGRYLLDVTLDRETYEKLLYAQALLGDEIPSVGFAEVIDRAFRALIEVLEE